MTNANDPINTAVEHTDGSTMTMRLSCTEIGLTKREYFAAMAMQGLLASFTQKSAIGAWNNETKETAEASVNFADALINALNETP